jgi:hypothetical protein
MVNNAPFFQSMQITRKIFIFFTFLFYSLIGMAETVKTVNGKDIDSLVLDLYI